jgi:hypothetical protein
MRRVETGANITSGLTVNSTQLGTGNFVAMPWPKHERDGANHISVARSIKLWYDPEQFRAFALSQL